MSSIGEFIERAASQQFVGRQYELQLMQQQLKLTGEQWTLLHFYGIPGIGKTTILQRFAKQTSSTILYFDAPFLFQSPQQFVEELMEQLQLQSDSITKKDTFPTKVLFLIDYLNKLSTSQAPLLLLFDSVDQWRPILQWIFQSFIPKLSTHIRIITAGRSPIEIKGTNTLPWTLVVQNVRVNPLQKDEVEAYLSTLGVTKRSLAYSIYMISNGIPFAMHYCSHLVHLDNQELDIADVKAAMATLYRTLLEELGIHTQLRMLLEAASIVGCFDKELLSHMTTQAIDYSTFDQLCELPIVLKGEDGWQVLHGVRNWIQTEFKDHSPDLFHTYKMRALEALHKRWVAATPLKRRNLLIEHLYALEHPLLREYYYLGDDSEYHIRNALEQDIPTLKDIWKNRHLTIMHSVQDGTVQESLFQSVWELESGAFKTFWKEEVMIGFLSIISFTPEMRALFQQNELYRPYLTHSNVESNERLIWVGATLEKEDYETLNVIFRYFFEQLMEPCLHTILLPTDYDISGLLSLGFVELPWAASSSPTGKLFRMLQLDARDLSFIHLLTTSYPGKTMKKTTQMEAIQWLKPLLVAYHDFEVDDALTKKTRDLLAFEEEVLSIGPQVREHIQNAMQMIANRSDKERMMMQAIQFSYIDQLGSNEIAAERLHLSISTYYRYLKTGIEKLALQLLKCESTKGGGH